ncbi:MAG: hypothetical protein HOP04_10805 [Methylophilaceae bacterium]|nr:hypothetical protein [Methylophilaceae bacterium]
MNSATVFQEQDEINNKLFDFDVTIRELQGIALEAVSARNEATILHSASAPGTYSYHAGLAALRLIFVSKHGWEMTRHNGVEGISNKNLGVVLLFQNVDVACSMKDPCPISSKGSGIAGLVNNPAGYLWSYMEDEDKARENTHVWFYCVSFNDGIVKAELSKPRAIKNGSFGTFDERIFIIQDDDWSDLSVKSDKPDTDDQDFDIQISKKA